MPWVYCIERMEQEKVASAYLGYVGRMGGGGVCMPRVRRENGTWEVEVCVSLGCVGRMEHGRCVCA